jgi:hypothetical protein
LLRSSIICRRERGRRKHEGCGIIGSIKRPGRRSDSKQRGRDSNTHRICAVDIWLWAHAWEESGCLGSPTAASDYWRIGGRITCHHRIDGYICRREDLPLGRELSFDVVRSVPNPPQHGPTVRPRSSRAPAKLAVILYNSRHVCQARWCVPPSHPTSAGRGRQDLRLYSLKRASRQSNAARSPFSCLI